MHYSKTIHRVESYKCGVVGVPDLARKSRFVSSTTCVLELVVGQGVIVLIGISLIRL